MPCPSNEHDLIHGNQASNDVRSFRVLPSQAPCHTLDEKADGYDPQHVQERLEMLIHDLRNSLSSALGYMQIVVLAAHEETKEDFETCVLESLSPMQSALWRVDILILPMRLKTIKPISMLRRKKVCVSMGISSRFPLGVQVYMHVIG